MGETIPRCRRPRQVRPSQEERRLQRKSVGMRPAAGQSRRSLVLAGQCCWRNNFLSPRALGSRDGLQAVPGGRDSPCGGSTAAPQAPASLEAGAQRSRRTQSPHCRSPRGAAGTPTSGHSACPQPVPGLRECQSSCSGEKGLSSPFGSWRKELFLHSGFCCSGFSAASRAAVAVPSGWRQRAPKKNKSKLRLEGWAAIAGSGECGIWFLCLYGLTASFFLFFFFYYERLLWQPKSVSRCGQCPAEPNPTVSLSISSLGSGFKC